MNDPEWLRDATDSRHWRGIRPATERERELRDRLRAELIPEINALFALVCKEGDWSRRDVEMASRLLGRQAANVCAARASVAREDAIQ